MSLYPWARPRVISGDVCFVRITVEMADDGPLDELPWRSLVNGESGVRDQLLKTVRETLGPEFEIRSLTVGRGSIEVLVLIGTTYYVISRYKNFVESIELMVRQLKEVVRHFFERRAPMHITVTASWTAGSGLTGQQTPQSELGVEQAGPTLWYLIFSHAAMLAVLLWLVVWRLFQR